MLPERSQIPQKSGQPISQNNGPGQGLANLWAEIRRLKSRVLSLETGLSTVRRDVNRVDRKQYRDEAKLPAANPTDPFQDPNFINELMR